MSEPSQEGISDTWPSLAVLLICAILLVAGYGVAVWRGPATPQEVRVVGVPAPVPAPEALDPNE